MYRIVPVTFLKWCAATSVAKIVAASTWSFPILETFHILGLVVLLGSVFVLNLTVLGVGVRMAGATLARQLMPWGAAGFALIVLTGIPMFMSAAPTYGTNDPFAIKMALLVTAVVVQTAIHRIPGMYAGSTYGRVAACLSLLCWFGVAYAGRAIAFTNLLGVAP